jgi:hypothetical protein
MMDYEGNIARAVNVGGGQAIKPMPELGRLKHAAERVAIQTQRLGNFIDRFQGVCASAGENTDCEKPIDSYRNDLSSLFSQIERLETLVSALDHIG